MHSAWRPWYQAATGMANMLASIAPNASGKVWRSVRARRGLLDRWAAQTTRARDLARPLVWWHAPSVGEGLQARPVAEAWRTAHPGMQQAYSFFSPSAEQFARSVRADFTEYLPFDSVQGAERLLDLLQPRLLVFVKLDVWPVLVERAVARGVPVALLSATLAEGSGRRSVWSRALLRDAYAALSLVGAIDAANAERLIDLGVPRSRVRVTGDTRFDQVWRRATAVDRAALHVRCTASDRPTLVAGSTWPSDEAVLMAAWVPLRRTLPAARLIIAPHEPTAAHLAPLLAWGRTHGMRTVTLGDLERGGTDTDADLIVVDRVGVLGDLYTHATAAYVGGGFHRAGLHSAIEPAAFGAPVLFGPRHGGSREAELLLAAGGAVAVAGATELERTLGRWLHDAEARAIAGGAAKAVVEAERGATDRSVALVSELLA
ncbi:3-deoxy-D-manno-octulosonic acid transferase [Gemmatimonas sp.]|jgi:3-deoxy-D-manno-octulosonic-acid transferase|uniref:3-deoxy-D-manno-octulosonic acid transferase n=1 Tax=Gemmatimonas sp. TaxID=1962908 RepID=UPI0037C17589